MSKSEISRTNLSIASDFTHWHVDGTEIRVVTAHIIEANDNQRLQVGRVFVQTFGRLFAFVEALGEHRVPMFGQQVDQTGPRRDQIRGRCEQESFGVHAQYVA